MIAKGLLISGGFVVGVVCVSLFAISLLYLAYGVVVGRLEKRSLAPAKGAAGMKRH